MVPAGNKAKSLSSVNHTTKTIHHHHHLDFDNSYLLILQTISHTKSLALLQNSSIYHFLVIKEAHCCLRLISLTYLYIYFKK